MTQYNTFNHKNSKLNALYSKVQEQKKQVPELVKPEPIEHSVATFKKNQKIEIDTTPQYYDLYRWWGVTYSSSPVEPASAYEFGNPGYYFKYPTVDFRVPKGSTPTQEVPGTDEDNWEYTSSIAIVKSAVFIKNINEKLLNYTKLKSYLYNDSNEPASAEDFSQITRWHKENNGYTFYYNAFFSVAQDDPQLLIKAELILRNPNDYDALYQTKLS